MFALPFLLLFLRLSLASAQQPTWCGKVYMDNETVVPPGGQFTQPASSSTPLLALRCVPALSPFLPEDVGANSTAIIVDALVRYSHILGAQDIQLPESSSSSNSSEKLQVTASIDGKEVASGEVGLNGTTLLPFSLDALTPRTDSYSLSCTASLPSNPQQQFTSSSSNITFLPNPPPTTASVTKLDLRTGGLLTKKFSNGQGTGDYERVLPVGFYSDWDGYLKDNDTTVETLAEQGYVSAFLTVILMLDLLARYKVQHGSLRSATGEEL
jgi:hypothetical protein